MILAYTSISYHSRKAKNLLEKGIKAVYTNINADVKADREMCLLLLFFFY